MLNPGYGLTIWIFGAWDLGFPAVASSYANSRRIAFHKSFLNSLMLRPASFTIPAMVKALMGLARGIVITCSPSVIVTYPTLACNPKPCPFKRLDSLLVVYPGKPGHTLPYFHVTALFISGQLLNSC
jgi:hypothetical protein